jgi:hypothetical protein
MTTARARRVYRYSLVDASGADQGEAYYAILIESGDIIWAGDRRKLRVVAVVPVEEEDSPFIGFLKVEPISL